MTVATPLPAVPHRQPRLLMLSRDDCEQVHQASRQILSRTGVKVYNVCGRELLRGAGATVDDDLVRIPQSLVAAGGG